MDQLSHTNRSGVETNLLPIIPESSWHKLFVIGGSQPYGSSGECLEDMTIHSPIIHSDQTTATIDRRVHCYWNIFLGILESLTKV